MKLVCVGLSHHTANVEMRERFLGGQFERPPGLDEALVLATCNRAELYAVAPDEIATETLAALLLPTGTSLGEDERAALYRLEAADCAQHLFRVAAGLDSMVLGETEILGQTKQAYQRARESGGVGSHLHRLFQRAFRAAKQVRARTAITRGAVSVGSVAVDLAEKIFGDLSARRVIILGAGETSERTARALVSRGVRHLVVANRSAERAERLAGLIGGIAVPFAQWEEHGHEADIVITSTSSPTPLLTRETLAAVVARRTDRPLFIIDIAVPRDVAPEVNELEGVYLYDIDSLQTIAAQSLELRRQQLAAAEAIIARHVAEFGEWLARGQRGGAELLDVQLRVSES